ncbi:uncharacterized protein M6B38_168160 [Iris pallida]|uniref:Co-chaperone protein p23 n=1 Tax=Iris pallida TaxID=29817 RepID=A0AAX6EVR4_IRIPA|nr:uncharacterized protein M6B38_168160 [Iris pallida]
MSRHPEVKWAQREDKVYITVLLSDAKNAKVDLQPDGVFTLSATAGTDGNTYEVKLNLHDKVNEKESKINIGERNIFCVVEKAEKGWWKKLLSGDAKTPHYVKVDWDKWADEDDEGAAAPNVDLGGMDFSSLCLDLLRILVAWEAWVVWAAWEVWVVWAAWEAWVVWAAWMAWMNLTIVMKNKNPKRLEMSKRLLKFLQRLKQKQPREDIFDLVSLALA